ncbi:LAQU0S02e06238g1_1 [Lachancea quebecensis]|uniref:LAQU0S02e06238g1_1 n=1 Tax=Lachancea quebecensis TaxID=1654605 RepID=A0A0P1KQQ6_9SACH|nr:LAQU0S02e06238g1_1 [Lachancea quebecensis]
MAEIQRRPSLMLDDEEDLSHERRSRLPSQVSDAPLDDTDMIALNTTFDRQIIQGQPMHLEFNGHTNPIHQEVGASQLKNHCHLEKGGCLTIFDIIGEKRAYYLKSSAQDALSNPKNDTNSWFLYPRPLPKFWKFEKDKRFQDTQKETPDNKEADHKGYFATRATHTDVYNQPGPTDRLNLKYTGKFFELENYAEEFQNVVGIRNTTSLSYQDVIAKISPIAEFSKDFQWVLSYLVSEELNSLATKRIEYLLNRFDLFQQLEGRTENRENRLVPHRDFYNVRKVDQNFLLSGCVSQRQLNEFIWEKLNLEPERIVYKDYSGKEFKLRQIFCNGADAKSNEDASIGLKAVDDLFLEWYQTVYLPGIHIMGRCSTATGKDQTFLMIAKTFLEFDNYMNGEYFAELVVRYVIQSFEKSKYQLAQLSVDFQFSEDWWFKFSNWITKWKLVSYNIRWNVRFGRSYTKLYASGIVKSFQDYLDYIFCPLFSAKAKNDMKLQYFLSTVCCFDLSATEGDDYVWKTFMDPQLTAPVDWSATRDNPPIAYYMFYLMEYVKQFNLMRRDRLQNPVTLRLYAPLLRSRVSQFKEGISITEQLESLICNVLLCQSGLLQAEPLWDASPAVLYLYYLLQIPVIVSPLSSVSIAQEKPKTSRADGIRDVTVQSTRFYTGNPFLQMQKIGHRVVLSSNSVLLNSSYTMEPIIEEYSVAASIYLLNSADLCEFVRNSIVTSGYEGFYKAHWNGIGLTQTQFLREKIGGTDVWYDQELDTSYKHNVPTTRRLYRKDCLDREWEFIRKQVPNELCFS